MLPAIHRSVRRSLLALPVACSSSLEPKLVLFSIAPLCFCGRTIDDVLDAASVMQGTMAPVAMAPCSQLGTAVSRSMRLLALSQGPRISLIVDRPTALQIEHPQRPQFARNVLSPAEPCSAPLPEPPTPTKPDMAPNWGAGGPLRRTLLCAALLLVATQVRGRADSGSTPLHPLAGAPP